jgi:hypothetical protein
MPSQGNDNRTSRTWQPSSAVAPASKWKSTHTEHYRHPSQRGSRNHEYWLRRASQRAAATADLTSAGVVRQPRSSHTWRPPSLGLAFNQPLRNPSSFPRTTNSLGQPLPFSLTARPLDASLRDTSLRSHNAFDAYAAQQHHPPSSVSALAMLEGQAAGSHPSIPNRATTRPPFERVYTTTQQAPIAHGTSEVPADVYPLVSQTHNSWQGSPAPRSSGYVSTSFRPAATVRADPSREDPRVRSQTFRPQITAQGTPIIPANVLLAVASSPARSQQRAREYQGSPYEEVAV